MRRRERKLFRIADEIAALADAEAQAREELSMLEHIDDDARRDALVSGHPIDRADARQTTADVERMRRHVEDLRRRRERLERRRDRMLGRS